MAVAATACLQIIDGCNGYEAEHRRFFAKKRPSLPEIPELALR
jgi:hypothetical protein